MHRFVPRSFFCYPVNQRCNIFEYFPEIEAPKGSAQSMKYFPSTLTPKRLSSEKAMGTFQNADLKSSFTINAPCPALATN